MIEGLVKAQVIDSKGIEGRLQDLVARGCGKDALQLLAERDVLQESRCQNQIFAMVAGELLARCTGADRITDDYPRSSGWPTWSGFFHGWVMLSTRDSTPAYGDNDYTSAYHNCGGEEGTKPSGWISTGAHKHLNAEIETHTCYSETLVAGRRSVYRTQKFLWLPSDFSSSNIRCAEWWVLCNNLPNYRSHNYTSPWRSAARVRFVDGSGTPIVLNKTANQSLLFEYTVRLTSL